MLFIVRTLALTTDAQQLDWQYEGAFSDDSEVALDIINSRWSHGGDTDHVAMAQDYFDSISSLETLYIWEGLTYRFNVERDDDGNVIDVSTIEYDDPGYDEFMSTLDRDGFPKMLTFPGRILTYDPKYDPPNYGRSTPAEREASKARVSISRFGTLPS